MRNPLEIESSVGHSWFFDGEEGGGRVRKRGGQKKGGAQE